MPVSERMSAGELRAAIGLAGIFGLRMFGLFAILPVFALYAGTLTGGDNLTLVGIALGAYGLTQAALQIPFGAWSDRVGRKPVMFLGLAMFALGSVIAGCASSIHGVIVGRALQGGGAISAVAIAMAADATREEHRTKVMALIGSTIGLTFAISLVLGPWMNRLVGVPGIFFLICILALAAIGVVAWLPEPARSSEHGERDESRFTDLLRDPGLARLNLGIFVLHAVLLSLFVAVPETLVTAGVDAADHWKIYGAVMLGATVLVAPFIFRGGQRTASRMLFLVSIVLVAAGYALLALLEESAGGLALALLVFFAGFLVLEAVLPALVAQAAPPARRGTALAIYSTVQFLGAFCGGAVGGALMQHFGLGLLAFTNIALLGVWFVLAVHGRAVQADTPREVS